jgi:hypothetical protein
MNTQKYFRYVNLSMFKSDAEKEIDINSIVRSLDKTLPDNLKNITEYLIKRKDFFLHNGKYAKIIRRRNFIILFNNLIITHAGLLNSFIEQTNTDNYFNITDKCRGLEKYIENINNQIRIRSNWIPKIDFDIDSTISILTSPIKLYNKNEQEYKDNFTEIFKKINDSNNQSSISPIWNRFCILKNINSLEKQFIENFIYVLGHNSENKINYIDEKKLKFILTDCGSHGKEYPYLEICNIVYENKSFYNNITKINNETFSLEKNYENALEIINKKLDFENTYDYEPPTKKQRTSDGKRKQSKRKQSKRKQSKRKQSKRKQSKRRQRQSKRN